MDQPDPNSCANCGAVASDRCGGCKVTKYCTVVCQKNNWPHHKVSCGRQGIELVVYRAGQLLQDLFFVMREATYENEIASIEEEGNNLIIQDAPVVVGKRTPFPNHLMRTALQKNMALSAFTCEEPFAFFHDILVQMLAGTDAKVDVLWANMKPPTRKVLVRNAQGEQGDSSLFRHAVIRISSKDGMAWIIDVTGPQYGIFTTCWPELDYMKKHVTRLREIKSIGNHKADFKRMSHAFLEPLWTATEKIEAVIPAWKSNTSLTLDTLLRKDYASFQSNSKKLMDYVRKALGMDVTDAITFKTTDTVSKDQSIQKDGEMSKPAGVENADTEQGACPDDDDSDFDYDDDEGDDYEDDYYGEDPVDRSAEVRSCGRLRR